MWPPGPRIPVANEGLAWNSHRRNDIILVVTGILERVHTQDMMIYRRVKVCCDKQKLLKEKLDGMGMWGWFSGCR